MKKLLGFILMIFSVVVIKIDLVAQCDGVTVEAFPLSPQTGNHNYFGVRVTLVSTYNQDITINGYIYDTGDPNTNHPFELTVIAGNLTSETGATFYETSPAETANAEYTTASPCPSSLTAESILLNISNASSIADLVEEEDSTGLCNFFLPTAIQIDDYVQWKYGYDIHENYDTSTATATMIIGLLYFAKENGFYINGNGTWIDPSSRIDPMDCFVTVLGDLIGLTTIAALYNAIVSGGSANTIKQFLKGAVRRVFAIISIGIAIYDLGHHCLGWWGPEP